VLAAMGLRLSPEKTLITHIDEGLDFLGWRIQRHHKRGTDRYYVYTYPAKKALRAITVKVKTACRTTNISQPLSVLLHRLNPMLRGWCAYFRPGVSSGTFGYLAAIAWRQVLAWLRRKHRRITWKALRRRYCGGRWWPARREHPAAPHRDDQHDPVPVPGSSHPHPMAGRDEHPRPHGACGEPGARLTGTPGSGGGPGKPASRNAGRAPRADLARRPGWRCSWPARPRPRTCPAGPRPASWTRRGWPGSPRWGCCGHHSCRRPRSGRCGTTPGPAPGWSKNAPGASSGWTSCWRAPWSSCRAWPPSRRPNRRRT
jgi:hypothetical protein